MREARAGRARAIAGLNAALVSEIARLHRDRGLRARDHRRADIIAERIVQLGGEPDYSSLRPALSVRGTARS